MACPDDLVAVAGGAFAAEQLERLHYLREGKRHDTRQVDGETRIGETEGRLHCAEPADRPLVAITIFRSLVIEERDHSRPT